MEPPQPAKSCPPRPPVRPRNRCLVWMSPEFRKRSVFRFRFGRLKQTHGWGRNFRRFEKEYSGPRCPPELCRSWEWKYCERSRKVESSCPLSTENPVSLAEFLWSRGPATTREPGGKSRQAASRRRYKTNSP